MTIYRSLLPLISITFLSACSFRGAVSENLSTLGVTEVTLAVNNSWKPLQKGGVLPLTFSASPESLGAINSNTGLYLAPSTPGHDLVSITDAEGTSVSIKVNVVPALKLNTTRLKMVAQSGHKYQFSTSGGVPPYSYSLLGPKGSIQSMDGTYTANGTALHGNETVKVTDSAGNSQLASVSIVEALTNRTVLAQAIKINSTSSDRFVGGNFSSVYPYVAPRIAKLDLVSGDLDQAWSANDFNGTIYDIAIKDDSIFIAGAFSTYRGVTVAGNLAKIDRAGNLDPLFNQATGPNSNVRSIAIQGNSVYIGGNFNTYRGATANYLAKIDSITGELDTAFTQASGPSGWVRTLVVDNSALFIGGTFSTYRGAPAIFIAKIDLNSGNLDTTFTQATGFNNYPQSLLIFGNALYVGGSFSQYRGANANYLAKLDPINGNLDTTFTQALGLSATANAIATDGTSLFVGGSFATYRGANAKSLAKIDLTSGALDATFTQATGVAGNVTALAINADGIYIGGTFSAYRGTTANYLAKLQLTSGNLDTTFTQTMGLNSTPYCLLINNGSLYVGGVFSNYRGTIANSIAKFDIATGAFDSKFNQTIGFDAAVSALVISGSSIYAGGGFQNYQGSTAKYLAKLDLVNGNLDATFTQATGPNSSVSSLATLNSSLFVGGSFVNYRGAAANYIAKMDLLSGNLDATFTQATGFAGGSPVNALLTDSGSVYAGGGFTTYRGASANYLAKLDATTGNMDASFTQASGFDSEVRALTMTASAIYAGGLFNTYRGATVKYLAKLDPSSGNLDTAFTQGWGTNSGVYALALSDNALFLGGAFSAYRGISAMSLAKVDLTTGNLDTTFTPPLGFNAHVYALSLAGTSVLAGGAFSTYQNEVSISTRTLDTITGQ